MQSIEERAAAAYELKATGKCNCSQSVVKVFQDKLPVGEDTLMKLTAGYAAGMGCMESTVRRSCRRCDGSRYTDRWHSHAPDF